MSVTEKILTWKAIQDDWDAQYYSENPDEDRKYSIHSARSLGRPLSPPIELPVWNSDETVKASPMLEEWFAHANGWSSFKMGRRALSVAEMKDPWLGLQHYLDDPDVYPEDERRHHMNFLVTEAIPRAINDELVNIAHEGQMVPLVNPRFVLFSLPTLSSIVGPEFLLFADSIRGPEPLLLNNDFRDDNLEAMLDRLIAQ